MRRGISQPWWVRFVLISYNGYHIRGETLVEDLMSGLVLSGGRLIDGTGAQPVDNATIVVRDGRIASVHEGPLGNIEAGAQVLDLQGRTVLPGLINAHIHIMMDAGPDPTRMVTQPNGLPKALIGAVQRSAKILRAGITTVRDLGGYKYAELTLRDAIAKGEVPGPRMLCAGSLITMTGGHGWDIGIEADGVDEVRKAVRQNLKQGTDCIKIMATGGVLTPGVEPGSAQLGEEEMRAGVEEAHKAGRHTASHAQGNTGVKNAIRAGIDTIEHGIFLDDEAIEMMIERGVVYVPTLAAPYQIIEAGEAMGVPAYAVEKSKRVADAHRQSFEWAVASGVTIAAGNDGGTPFNPSDDLVTELRLMVDYGMNPLAAIRTATLGSAKALKLSEETGTIRQGLLADIIVLEEGADPLKDITAIGRVESVIKQGKIVVGG
jgi:imidazolonepropionase-like amidohydrolase